MTTPQPKGTRGGRVYFILCFQVAIHHWGKIGQEPEAEGKHLLSYFSYIFLIDPKTTCLGLVPPIVGWTLTVSEDTLLQTWPQVSVIQAVLQLKVPPPGWLCCVKSTIKMSQDSLCFFHMTHIVVTHVSTSLWDYDLPLCHHQDPNIIT